MTNSELQIVKPIFLVGFPRSGTTFLQSLLSTQHGIVTFPETHFYSVLTGYLDTSKGIQRSSVNEVIERATSYLELNIEEQNKLEELGRKNEFVDRRLFFEKLIELLCVRQEVTIGENKTLLEKTPSHAFHLEKIAQDFPDLRVIHLTRHPIDSISSYQKHLSQGKKSISELSKEWIRSHDSVEQFAIEYPDRVYRVKYESLRDASESEMEHLLSWLGIEPDFEKMKQYSTNASDYIMSFESWKENNTEHGFKPSENSLSLKGKAEIQYLLGSRMKTQGYTLRSPVIQYLYNIKNGGSQ